MSIFKKRAKAQEVQHQNEPGELILQPAQDTATIIGGLDWYRTQFHRAMKLALCLIISLCLCLTVSAMLLLN